MSLEKVQNLSVSFQQEGASFVAILTWSAVRTYDKIVVQWGIGDMPDAPSPDSADISGTATSYSIHGALPATSYVFKVESGTRIDGDVGVTVAWQYSGFVAVVAATPAIPPFGVVPQLLFYSATRPQADNTFIASLSNNRINVDPPARIGGWESDWTTLNALHFPNDSRILLYRHDGAAGFAFVAPLIPNGGNLRVGTATSIGNWEGDWTQITSFDYLGVKYLVLYAQHSGAAYLASVAPNGAGLTVGSSIGLGLWEKDWTQIKALVFDGEPYLLLYRNAGSGTHGFLAHVAERNGRLAIETPTPTTLPAGLALIEPILFDAAPWLLLYGSDGVPWASQVIAGSGGAAVATRTPTRVANGWESDWSQIVFLQQ